MLRVLNPGRGRHTDLVTADHPHRARHSAVSQDLTSHAELCWEYGRPPDRRRPETGKIPRGTEYYSAATASARPCEAQPTDSAHQSHHDTFPSMHASLERTRGTGRPSTLSQLDGIPLLSHYHTSAVNHLASLDCRNALYVSGGCVKTATHGTARRCRAGAKTISLDMCSTMMFVLKSTALLYTLTTDEDMAGIP